MSTARLSQGPAEAPLKVSSEAWVQAQVELRCAKELLSSAIAKERDAWRALTVTRDGYSCRLTLREKRVLALVRQELSNKEIAAALCVAERTAKSHVATLLAKFGVKKRYEL